MPASFPGMEVEAFDKMKIAGELAPDGVRGASRVGRLGVRMLAFSDCGAGSEGNGSEFKKV